MRRSMGILWAVFLLFGSLCTLTACKGSKNDEYRITARYVPEEKTLYAQLQLSFTNRTENALSCIPFALCRGMQVESVDACAFDVGGKENRVLTVSLSKPLYPDERTSLSMRFSVMLEEDGGRLGVNGGTVALGGFYPQLPAQHKTGFYGCEPSEIGDGRALDCADFYLTLSLPEGYVLACGGSVFKEEKEGGTTYTVTHKNAREIACAFGEFSCVSARAAGVQTEYYYLLDDSPEVTLTAACRAIQTFAELFGKYPYERYVLAQTPLNAGGMEYSGFVMLSAPLKEMPFVVAHETAHQWWYASVGSDEYNCAWQDESLAEYSVALFLERQLYGKSYREFVEASLRAYRAYCAANGNASTAMSRPLDAFSGEYEYRVLCYDKGVVMFDCVRQTLGERKFFSCLKTYARRYRGAFAEEGDLIACFPQAEELILSFTQGRCVV